jgi:hypothetical protein
MAKAICASYALIWAIALALTNTMERMAENELAVKARETVVADMGAAVPFHPLRKTWERDEERRIEQHKMETFDSQGRWIHADPDPKATWARQMKELGWDKPSPVGNKN